MKHVKVLLNRVSSLQICDSCNSVVLIDSCQVVTKIQINAFAEALVSQSF